MGLTQARCRASRVDLLIGLFPSGLRQVVGSSFSVAAGACGNRCRARSCWLVITAAVAAPVGDFFGAGLCEVASFASRYFGTSSGGFFCKWPMPFHQSFRVELENVDADHDTEVF